MIRKCKICGKEFEARGNAKCCSSECSRINTNNNQKKWRQSEKGKEYYQSNEYKESIKKYNQSEKGKATFKRYNQSKKGKATSKRYKQNKIARLNEKYDGDLSFILETCPNSWMIREAIMQVEYGVSYVEAMYQKEKISPVCEITGRKDNLVIHHLDSFNLHPEKGADLDNLVRITKEIHDEFHSIYGYGSNTREQWFEFLENNQNIYI